MLANILLLTDIETEELTRQRYALVYLKSVGVDPATHPVMTELVRPAPAYLTYSPQLTSRIQERVKTYFGKLHSAENKDARPSRSSSSVSDQLLTHVPYDSSN